MRKNLFVIAAGLAGLALTSAYAADVTESTDADVIILEQLDVIHDESLDFGVIDKPATGSQSFSVSALGVSTTTGTGSFITPGSAGSVIITGSNGYVIDTTTDDTGACTDSGLNLTIVQPTDFPSSVTLMGGTQTNGLGGTLSVTSAVAAGDHTCPYSVTAAYQ